jgi:hypothetical protein
VYLAGGIPDRQLTGHAAVEEAAGVVDLRLKGDDGPVSPGDLAALPLSTDLVVLSACRSAGAWWWTAPARD